MNYKYIVGVDEVGRGPLAGPVYVCSAKLAIDNLEGILHGIDVPVRDSKKLTEKMREKWFVYLEQKRKEGLFDYTISSSKASEIDKLGVSVCITGCVNNTLHRLVLDSERKDTLVLLDGGLKAPVEYSQQTIIRGDENEVVIAFASIMAKVLRDRLMTELHTKFPHYSFDEHKGYGTQKHSQAIRNHGVCEEHRVSFLRNIV